jgi:hypothetical protein
MTYPPQPQPGPTTRPRTVPEYVGFGCLGCLGLVAVLIGGYLSLTVLSVILVLIFAALNTTPH